MKSSCIWSERQVSAVAIKIDDLADAVARELAAYSQECMDELKSESNRVAKEAAEELKATSPRRYGGYARGWKTKMLYENDEDFRIAVHNVNYRLPHLLEFGHAKVTGGRVAGKPHIEPARDNAVKKLGKKVKVIFKR